MAKKRKDANSKAGIHKDDAAIDKSVEELMGPAPGYAAVPDKMPPRSIPVFEHTEQEKSEPASAPVVEDTPPKEAEAKDVPAPEETPKEPAAETIPESTKPESQLTPAENPPQSEDPVVEEAVDDIVAKESDTVLEAEDEKLQAAFRSDESSRKHSIKGFFAAWWNNRKARWATIILLAALLIAAGTVPTSRYFVLNAAGARSSASLAIFDDSTQQPLRNVKVTIGGQSNLTDQNGFVRLERLKLGQTTMVVERRAFAPVQKSLIIGWGSNPLGEFKLTPVGAQYLFSVKDFASGKPLAKAEVLSGDASAFSDEKGKVVLTVEEPGDADLEVTVKAGSYRNESLTINPDDKQEKAVAMVPARKHVFVSRRSGKYDVYKIDVDGKNEELLLAGTGTERDDMVLVSHPTADVVALVSTRDNKRNKDKFLLSTLSLIDVNTGAKTDIVQSERVQVVDWVGDRIVYVQIAEGESASSANRHRLTSFDYKKEDKLELASSNYFNDVLAAEGNVYYAPSAATDAKESGLLRISANGSGRQTVLDKEVWNIFRVDYEKLHISAQQEWYEHRLNESKAIKLSGAPANVQTRIYSDNSIKQKSLWVEERDGKGVLLAYDLEKKADDILRTQSGLQNPVYWLDDNYIVYRIHTDQESADYIINTDGGEPRKIRDVSNVGGVDSWYYY